VPVRVRPHDERHDGNDDRQGDEHDPAAPAHPPDARGAGRSAQDAVLDQAGPASAQSIGLSATAAVGRSACFRVDAAQTVDLDPSMSVLGSGVHCRA